MKNFIFAAGLTLLSFTLKAQWTLKHASSVLSSVYLICHSVINNTVYLVGTPNGSSNYVYAYDPLANTYTQKAPATTGFNDQVSFTLGNQMYLVTMSNQSSAAYDPAGNNWVTKDNNSSLNSIMLSLYPPSSYGMVFNGSLFSFSLNGKGYIGGLTIVDMSTSVQSVSPYVFVYDPLNNNYSVATVPSISTSYNMLSPAMFELNGKGYLVGSTTDPGTFGGGAGTFEFDPTANSFTTRNNCNCGNLGYSAFVLNNLAYLNVNNTCSDTTWVYTFDPAGNSWSPSDPIALVDSADLRLGFAANGKGYLGYGFMYNSSCGINGGHSRLFEYTPSSMGITQAKADFFDVYPNPAQNNIIINSGHSLEARKFVLTSLVGEELVSWYVPAGQSSLRADISQLPEGLYFLDGGNGTVKKKIIVCR